MKIQVRVGALAHGGAFVADIVSSEGEVPRKKVFIRNVAPGELVEAEVAREEKNLIHATLLQIIEASPNRVTPPCPWFGTCGGCDLQYLSIDAQREAKREMVERTLQFQGKLTPRTAVELLGKGLPEYKYRRRVSLHVNESGQIGFYRAESADVVDIHYCLLADDHINAALKEIRQLMPDLCKHIDGVTLEDSNSEVFCVFNLRDGAPFPFAAFNAANKRIPNLIVERDSKILFVQHKFAEEKSARFPAGHFSQVNEAANEVLIATVSKLIGATHLTELYAGAGNFSIPLARQGALVDAVEADPSLARHGKEVVSQLGLADKISFFETTCERYLRHNRLQETVLLDPPRTGAKSLLEHFLPERTKRIVYVSCSLPTLTRDLKELAAKGYVLESVQLLDMFSQTHHVETISVLTAE